MRLNLGEVAQALGCGPDKVIWDGGTPDGRGKISSIREVVRERAPGGLLPRSPGGEYAWSCDIAPWAGLYPTGAQVDSRLIAPGDLFFCLPGERADGHDFAFDAARAGAVAVIAARNPFAGAAGQSLPLPPVFLVDDVKEALWRAAVCHRDTSLARVVGITGTAGKTSVKEVLAQVLAVKGLTGRNPRNFNNQIGLPVSMLNAAADASFWIMEVGISENRDMKELGSILRPDLGVILNVGDAHIIGLGERGVAANKAMLLDYIQPGGVAVVSVDYPELTAEVEKRRGALERKGVQVATFSAYGRDASCRARYKGPGTGNSGRYAVAVNGYEFFVEAPFRGEFGAENAAAILSVAFKLGLSPSDAEYGLSLAALPDQRFHIRHFAHHTVVDDSYNANPLSAKRMIQAAAQMSEERNLPLILVMGEMLELGDKAGSAHEDLGREMARAEPLLVFWKGGHGADVTKGLKEAGYAGRFYPVAGGQEFSLLLEELDIPEGLLLFKGSRGNRLERLVEIFLARLEPEGEPHAV